MELGEQDGEAGDKPGANGGEGGTHDQIQVSMTLMPRGSPGKGVLPPVAPPSAHQEQAGSTPSLGRAISLPSHSTAHARPQWAPANSPSPTPSLLLPGLFQVPSKSCPAPHVTAEMAERSPGGDFWGWRSLLWLPTETTARWKAPEGRGHLRSFGWDRLSANSLCLGFPRVLVLEV